MKRYLVGLDVVKNADSEWCPTFPEYFERLEDANAYALNESIKYNGFEYSIIDTETDARLAIFRNGAEVEE